MQIQHVLFSKSIKNAKFFWLWPRIWSAQLCNGFTLCCGFICFICFNCKIVVNFDFNCYYPRINKEIIIIIEAHFCTSNCCFSLDYLTFHFNQNRKANSSFQNYIPQSYRVRFCYLNWCMYRENNLRTY